MAQIGIMIEGQDGLNWERWKRILTAVEDLGYQCVFRSDHFTNASGPHKDALEMWTSLTYAASVTKRIEFGPLVTPVTFRHPSMNVKYASAIDDLSDGRLVFGLGTGWQDREHKSYGIAFPELSTRYEMLEDALEVTLRLFMSDGPINYAGKHYQLEDAMLLPRPKRPGGPPILIGGNGPKRTLPLVAQYADEWNSVFLDHKTYAERTGQLNSLLEENGRTPDDVKRSIMTRVIFGKDDAAVKARLALSGADAQAMMDRGNVVGTPQAIVDQLGKWTELGVERFMLQWLELDDIEGLEDMAAAVLPHFHKA